jgi:predicted HAD superfamily hydrolase
MLFNKIYEHTSYQIQCHIGINTAQYLNMLYDRPNATRSRNIKSWLQKFYSRNHDVFHQCDYTNPQKATISLGSLEM